MIYNVHFGGRCWKTVAVEADSPEEAEEQAWDMIDEVPWEEKNIDDVECYGAEPVIKEAPTRCRGTSVNDMIG